MCVGVAAVQQVVDVVGVVRVVRWEGVRMLVGDGKFAVVAEVVQVLVVLLDGSGGGETESGAVVFSEEHRRTKYILTTECPPSPPAPRSKLTPT